MIFSDFHVAEERGETIILIGVFLNLEEMNVGSYYLSDASIMPEEKYLWLKVTAFHTWIDEGSAQGQVQTERIDLRVFFFFRGV